jgi:asparagine synthase (glutamine-hydrolysing)
MLQYDWKYTLADNDLPKVVTTCDLAGVQIAFPMLAEPLVDFANALPPSWKVSGARLRPFFKSALADFLPKAILEKKKHGFGLPFGHWLVNHSGLRRLAIVSLESFRHRGVIRESFLNDFLTKRLHEHAGYYGELVWIMMMLELWMQRHAPSFQRCSR